MTFAFKSLQTQSGFYLTGQVVAACVQVRLTPQDFGSSRERDFAKLNLHLPACRSLGAGRGIFDQPEEKRALTGSPEENNPPLPPFSKGGMGGFGIRILDIILFLVLGI